MSVNTSEEYLDELLDAIEPIIHTDEVVLETSQDSRTESVEKEEVMEPDVAVQTEPTVSGEGMEANPEVATEEAVSVDALLESFVLDETDEQEEGAMSEEDIDAMLNAAINAAAPGDTKETESDVSTHDEDVKELLKQFTEDEDLTDISDILERHDNGEAVDESLLQTPDVEVFKMEDEEIEEEIDQKKEKAKGLFGFFKRKKKKDEKSDESSESEEKEIEIHALTDNAPKANVEVELGDYEWEEMSSVKNTVAPEEVEEIDAGIVLEDNDTSDIEMILSGGILLEDEKNDEEEIQGITEKSDALPNTAKKKRKSVKKESFFSKIYNLLTEEEEETPKKTVPEADVTGVTDENIAILDELSKEDKKKAKLDKKEQKRKEKEAKKKGKDLPKGEEEDEDDSKKEKKQKKVKVKKEKPRKVVELDEKPEKKLSRKKVSVVFLFCFSVLAMILILQNVFLNFSNLKEARWAFDNADYETCYVNLYGKDLSEEDQEIFDKSYVILTVQRKLDSYENFVQLGMDLEALDALFEGVRVYRDMEERANELGILDRISGIYETIYEHFSDYGLTSDDVEEILDYESKVTYTRRLDSIVNGTPFEETVSDIDTEEESPADAEGVVEEEHMENEGLNPEELEDVLEQEEDFLGDL